MERPKIELYRVRMFGEKLNDTFGFVSENLRVLLKYLTYFLLPLSLVQALALNGYMGAVMNMVAQPETSANGVGVFLGLAGAMSTYMLIYGVGVYLLMGVVYGLMRVYFRRKNRLRGLAWSELRPDLLHVLKRGLVLVLLSFVIGMVMVGLMGVLPALGAAALTVLLWVAALVVGLPLSLVYPIYLFEDETSLVGALRKSFHLGFPTWGGILGVLLVLGIVISILQGVVSLPWLVVFMVRSVMGFQDAGSVVVNSVGYSFATYLLAVVMSFGSFLFYSLYVVGLAIQYGHAAEKIDSVTVADDIERFESL